MLYPVISIIIPAYNASCDIEHCIDALKGQCFVDFEAIIIDDGSKDDTYDKCKKLIEEDSRFTIIHQDNKGVSAARNRGIKAAKGQYLCFADVDDVVLDNYLGNFMTILERFDPDLVMQSYQVVSATNKYKKKLPDRAFDLPNDYDKFFTDIEVLGYCAPFCKLFKRSLLERMDTFFNVTVTNGEDYDFLIRYLRCCKSVYCSHDVTYLYKINANSLSRKKLSYMTEWKSFQAFYKTSIEFQQEYHIPQVVAQMNRNVVYFMVGRLWPSLYQCGMMIRERMAAFRNMTDSHIKIVPQYYNPTSVVERLLLYLWGKRWFGMLDAILQLLRALGR